ncbi:MAG: YbjQ family protein [Proteobacteria bacterium]|nr:YbjQ family protein [Pseudomonadota bacterium]MBU1612319.1 YbjQ family protein [Pseudomonadota bacterium]
MFISNLETIPGMKIVEHYGLVTGSTVRARNVFVDIGAMLKSLWGGELKGYTKLLYSTNEVALQRLEAQAEAMGANAVVNVRYATSSVALGASELYAYGTAVSVE